MTSLFSDDVISKAEEVIGYHEGKQHSGGSHKNSIHYHPYYLSAKIAPYTGQKSGHQHGSNSATAVRSTKVKARPAIDSDRPRVTVLINDNYCVPQWGCVQIARRKKTVDIYQTLNINCFAVNHVPFSARQPQKKGVSSVIKQIKIVKGVSCVEQLLSVQLVTNVHTVAQNLL